MVVVPSKPRPPKDPYFLEDGGLYIEPFYWLNREQPHLHAGSTATVSGTFDYNGNSKAALGGEIGIPAGPSNTLRFTYFRVQGNSNVTLGQAETIFGEAYAAGDFINARSRIQAMKVSWDYLSYTWHKPSSSIHLKTLYEVQYVTTSVNMIAPLKAVTTDSSGTVNNNTVTGSKNLILPTFGMAMGSRLGKYFRWDIRGSGFGIPHKGVIGDAEGTLALKLGKVELLAGDRLYYFKTSTKGDMYIRDMLQGPYGGLRFVWSGKR